MWLVLLMLAKDVARFGVERHCGGVPLHALGDLEPVFRECICLNAPLLVFSF